MAIRWISLTQSENNLQTPKGAKKARQNNSELFQFNSIKIQIIHNNSNNSK